MQEQQDQQAAPAAWEAELLAPTAPTPEARPMPAEWEVLAGAWEAGAVDLSGVWEPLQRDLVRHRGHGLVDRLEAEIGTREGWTVVRRLRQACAAMHSTPDGAVYLTVDTPQEGRIGLTAWHYAQDGGLPWRVEAVLAVEVTDTGRTRVAGAAPVRLTTAGWSKGAITYTDGAGVLAEVTAAWFAGYMGRLGLQGAAGIFPEAEEVEAPPPLLEAEFAALI